VEEVRREHCCDSVRGAGLERGLEVLEMIYFLDTTYPGTKVIEISTMFLERLKTEPMPEYVKLLDSYAMAGGDGIRALMFYEVEDSKVKEGADYISRGVIKIMKAVEGYKVDFLTAYRLAEAFGIIDMELPAV
jgi:hypothetical protein